MSGCVQMGGFSEIERSSFINVLYPALVVVVAARSENGESAMPAAWNTPLSLNPPLLGVAIAPERYTYRLILESKSFTVNLLPFEFVEKLSKLGDVSGRHLKDKIRRIGLTVVEAENVDSIAIGESSGIIECELESALPVGDHDLIVGRVVQVKVRDGLYSGTTWDLNKYRPILYVGRTRRPAKVVRRYVTAEASMVEVPYAPGELREHVEARRKLIDAVRRRLILERSNIAKEYGVDLKDINYILEGLEREEV